MRSLLARVPLGLLLAVTVYVALRGAVLWTSFDQVSLPMYELYPIGTLARMQDLGTDLPVYVHYDNSAGGFVDAQLARVLFALWGPSFLVYKLVPALIGLGALLALWGWMQGAFGRTAANVAALLFAVGPSQTLFSYSLIGTGNHFENLFYLALTLWAFDAAHRRGLRPGGLFLAGLAAGLNLFVFLGAILTVGITWGMHLCVRGWRGAAKDLRAYAPGLLLGLSPLVYVNLMASGRGLQYLTSKFGGEAAAGTGRDLGVVLERTGTFLTDDLSRCAFFGRYLGLDEDWPAWVLLGGTALLALALLPGFAVGLARGLRGLLRAERAGEEAEAAYRGMQLFPFLAFLPLAALAFGLSDLRNGGHRDPWQVAGYRYFLPILFLFLGLVAAAVGRARGRWRIAALVVAGALGVTGVWNLRLVRFGAPDAGVGARYEGFNFVQAARGLLSSTSGLTLAEVRAQADAFPERERRLLYQGLGFQGAQRQLVLRYDANGDGEVSAGEKRRFDLPGELRRPLDLDALLAPYPADVHRELARGAGAGLRTLAGNGGPTAAALQAGLEALVVGGHPRAREVLTGAMWIQDYAPLALDTPRVLNASAALAERYAPSLRDPVGRGLGLAIGRVLSREHPPERALMHSLLRTLVPTYGAPLLEGVGVGLAEARAEPVWPADLQEIVRQDALPLVLAAWTEELVHQLGVEGARAEFHRLPAGLVPYAEEALGR